MEDAMPTVPETLANWQKLLCRKIDVGSLIARNPTAHKWKATFRSLELRETAFWRSSASHSAIHWVVGQCQARFHLV